MNKGFVLILLAALLGACIVPFAKIASHSVPPLSLVFWRTIIASVIFLPIAIAKKEKISLEEIKKLAPLSAILSINFVAAMTSVFFIPTSLTPVVYATTPIITHIILQIKNKKFKVEKMYAIGTIVGFVGLLLATYQNISLGSEPQKIILGVLMVLVGVICFSYYGVRSKEYQKDLSPLQISWINVIVIAMIMLPFGIYDIFRSNYLEKVDSTEILALLGVALFGSVLNYLVYQYAVKHTSPSIAALFTYIQPIFGVAISILLIGETITPIFLIGGTMALLGAYIASK
ncbi:MAG: DMT family transporter [Patescibacteria group bacterium]